jgi:nicotinate-nucleotide pyrophosphorylase (carboxylating)
MKNTPSNDIPFEQQYSKEIGLLIVAALKEDIGVGDFSGLSCLSPSLKGTAQLIVKQNCVLAGLAMAKKIFYQFDPTLELECYYQDGDKVAQGSTALKVTGLSQSILATERLVLNCMQRMSGIASMTHELQSLIAHTSCKILDTRKTTPNFRVAEKWAVAIGGGVNHRMGLYDTVMLKDNHIDFCGGISKAIEKTKSYLNTHYKVLPIIVECRNLEEVNACMAYPDLHRILLDNMDLDLLREAVALIDGSIPTEASGNITSETLVQVAETGVDFVSMGAITYSAPIVDMSLKAL